VTIIGAQEHLCEVARNPTEMKEIEGLQMRGDFEEDVERQG
jgi:hypothetical protein